MVTAMALSFPAPLEAADLPVTGRSRERGVTVRPPVATDPDVLWKQASLEWDSLQSQKAEADYCLFLERYYLFPDWVERAAERISFRAKVEVMGLNTFRVEVEGGCGKEPQVAFEPVGRVISYQWKGDAFIVQLSSDAITTMTLRTAWGAAASVRLDAAYQEISAEISIDDDQQLLRIENIRGGKPGLRHVLRIEAGDQVVDTFGIGPGNNYLSVSQLAPLKPGREYRFQISDSRQSFFSEPVELQIPAGSALVSESWLLIALLLAGCNMFTILYYEVLRKN